MDDPSQLSIDDRGYFCRMDLPMVFFDGTPMLRYMNDHYPHKIVLWLS